MTQSAQIIEAGRTRGEILYPSRSRRAGPEFFATNQIGALRHWPRERLADLGAVPFPMCYGRLDDRYSVIEWGAALAKLAMALAKAEDVVLIGNQTHSDELESLQLLLSNVLAVPIDLLRCWDEQSPGHVWSSTSDIPGRSSKRRVIMLLGKVPPPVVFGLERHDLLAYLGDEVIPAMFEIDNDAVVLPVNPNGWKLSHIAFHRLMDIEAEQCRSAEYGAMFESSLALSRPLCSIVAEIVSFLKSNRIPANASVAP